MAPLAERPIDLFFAGYKTTNRTRFFVENAAYLADKNCFLAYADPPPTAVKRDNFTERLFSNNIGLASITKVILTMHRYPVGYFEWEAAGEDGPGGWIYAVGLACALRHQQLRCGFEYCGLQAFFWDAWTDDAGLLCASRGSRKGEEVVCAGAGDARCL